MHRTSRFLTVTLHLLLLTSPASAQSTAIDRHALVTRYNPSRSFSSLSQNASALLNYTTPLSTGNGNLAFNADLTGLHTLLPFPTLSSWGFKNDSLPPNRTLADLAAYRGVRWPAQGGRTDVQYLFGVGGEDAAVEQWLIANPNRADLGRVGFVLLDPDDEAPRAIGAEDVSEAHQTLDLWTGALTSTFTLAPFADAPVTVRTACDPTHNALTIAIASPLLAQGTLGIFLDFPWSDGSQKFGAPFVGSYAAADVGKHETVLSVGGGGGGGDAAKAIWASVRHTMVNATFYTTVYSDGERNSFAIARDGLDTHRYTIRPAPRTGEFSLAVAFSPTPPQTTAPSPHLRASAIMQASAAAWTSYWSTGGFVDLVSGTNFSDPRADELQRRVILSRYLMRVNAAGDAPPQESGLVNNGWYGKFHMEEYFWHAAHWALWSNQDILRRSSSIYGRFLSSALARAQAQGWVGRDGRGAGARWPKMTDDTGREAPGEINELLIWEQPHALVFAEYERRAAVSAGAGGGGGGGKAGPAERAVLEKWAPVVRATADWMAAYAWRNASTGWYGLGAPMYVVSEDTAPNATRNPAFELAYWRLGLGLASGWLARLGEEVPGGWEEVREGLAPLPLEGELYAVYEGIGEGWWDVEGYVDDHPALVGLYGWLPATEGLDLGVQMRTVERVWEGWNFTNCWGWDFPMLAMSAARMGEKEKAVAWLLDPLFAFDEVGMPVGGVRVPTPYFPGAGALLYAVAMMAGGWDGDGYPGNRRGEFNGSRKGVGFPDGWDVRAEGLMKAM